MSLEKEISELIKLLKNQAKKPTFSSKIKDLATILTPVILMIGGFVLNGKLESQKQQISVQLENIRDARIAAGQKIEQSKLLNSLKTSFLSSNNTERQLAINIALHACGESGRDVVAAIGIKDSIVRNQLDFARLQIIDKLIDDNAGTRWNAAEELSSSWAKDDYLIPDLLTFVEINLEKPFAIYNSLAVLADLPGKSYLGRTKQVRDILKIADTTGPSGPKTSNLKSIINSKLSKLPEEEF